MKKLIGLLGVLAVVGLTPLAANAGPRECDANPEVTFSPYQNAGFGRSGNNAIATVTIRTEGGIPTCEPVEAVLVSYTAEGPTWPTSGRQVVFDSMILRTTWPGRHVLSVELPPCFFQVDFDDDTWFPRTITYPWDWPGELIAYENGGTDEGCDEGPPPNPGPNPGPHPGPGPFPQPEPEPVNHPRASIRGTSCEDHTFYVTLDNEHSDEAQVFILKLNGKTHRALEVRAGRTVTLTVHAHDGDRLQVFAGSQLAEADAELGQACNEHETHLAPPTEHRHGRGPERAGGTAMTGSEVGNWPAVMAGLLLAGVVALIVSRKRRLA